MRFTQQRIRFFTWIIIILVVTFATGLYFWSEKNYATKAGTTVNAPTEDPLSQGLVGYWKMDEGTGTSTTADASGNATTLSMTGPPTWTTGQIGPSALDFSGTGQYLSAASPTDALDFIDGVSFTIAGWFNRDTFANDHTILSTKSGQSTESDGYIAYVDDATDALIIRFDENGSTDARTFTSTTTFASTGWHHFALSWNEGVSDATLYIDGKPDGSGSGTTFANMGDLSNANAFSVGAETDAGNLFDGKLDDIRVYNYALSAEQMKKLYGTTTPSQPVDTSLVGHWTFDGADIQGGMAIDRSGKGNTGILSQTINLEGKLGQGIYVNGTIYLGNPPKSTMELGTADRTIVGWVKFSGSSLGYTYYIFGKGGEGTEGYNFYYDGSSAIAVNVHTESSGGTYFSADCPSLFNTGWRQVAAVIDRDAGVYLYLDGALLNHANTSVYNGIDVTNTSQEASLATAGFNPIGLDDIRIYNRTLSASEIYQLYTSGNAKVNTPPDDPLSQSLRGYWKMDEGTGTSTTADASGNANTLSMTGPPTWTTGIIGPSAMDFSGSGQYLSVASPASGVLDFVDGADFTITGWFNRDLFAADHTIVAKKTDQTTNAGYVIWIDNNGGTDYLNFEISDGTDTYSVASATDFSATGWHNFAAVWNDSNGMYLYIDGGLNGSTTTSTSSIGSLENANAFRIGAESDAGVPFDGKIDDIRVYGFALSAGDVAKLYQTTVPTQPVDTGLVGHWTFDGPDIQGTTAIDRSSFGNNGTITGTTKTIGKLGQGLSFDGSGDSMILSSGFFDALPTPDLTDFSVSMWVNPESFGTDFGLFGCEDAGPSNCSNWAGNSFGYVYLNGTEVAGETNSAPFSVSTDPDFILHEWQHLVFVRDAPAGDLFVYRNGILVGTGGEWGSDYPFGFDSVGIAEGQSANGKIDDVRVYNRVLTETEITGLYKF